MNTSKSPVIKTLRISAVLLVTLVALWLRLLAVEKLPIDYDEADYFLAAQRYAIAFIQRDWQAVVDQDLNYEHPQLAKMLYGVVLTRLPQTDIVLEKPSTAEPAGWLPEAQFLALRLTSALLGVGEVLLLGLLNPMAGLFLAVHTFTIKYTSQIMIEALPALTSLVAGLAYARSALARSTTGKKRNIDGWLVLSGAALGLTAASKYIYAVIGVSIIAHAMWNGYVDTTGLPGKERWRQWRSIISALVLWGLTALAVFFLADVYLWKDPMLRLRDSIGFNFDFSQSEHVEQASLPSWQPFNWLFQSVPWHPGVFVVSIDVLITLLAAAGLKRLWLKNKFFVFWLVVALGFLIIWKTKWPQYILIMTAPLSLAAAEGVKVVFWEPIVGWLARLEAGRQPKLHPVISRIAWREVRKAMPWLLPGVIVLGTIALFPLVFQGAMALTDFRATSIKDGLTGGVWREVWLGLSGQVEAVDVEPFTRSFSRVKEVHYAGFLLLRQLVTGFGNQLLVFEGLWTALSVGLQLALGVGVALLLHRRGVLLKGLWRVIFILPWAIPEFVGALIWARMFEPRFGWLVMAASFPETPGFLINPLTSWQERPDYALLILLVASTWYGFPFMMAAASASLKMIPDGVYDAASLDGAGAWSRFRWITLPLVLPLLIPAVIVRAIFAFNQFYLFYVLQTPYPLMTLSTLSFFIFDTNSSYGGQFAVSAAINLLTVALLIIILVWFNRWSRAGEGVTYA